MRRGHRKEISVEKISRRKKGEDRNKEVIEGGLSKLLSYRERERDWERKRFCNCDLFGGLELCVRSKQDF